MRLPSTEGWTSATRRQASAPALQRSYGVRGGNKSVGGALVLDAGKPVPVRGAKQRALLAMLALQRGRRSAPDRLIDELWDEEEVTNPANALQAQIGQLRRTLGADAVVTSEAGYALSIGPGDLDADRFERLVAEGRRLSDNNDLCQASTVLTEALRLIDGEPLSEFAYSGLRRCREAPLRRTDLGGHRDPHRSGSRVGPPR